MASNITVDTLTKGSTTLNTDEIVDTSSSQICKAWVNFNGTGTVAIRDSFNVSSITDYGTGNWEANFTTAFSNSNHSAVAGAKREPTTNYPMMVHVINITTTAVHIFLVRYDNAATVDSEIVTAQVFSN